MSMEESVYRQLGERFDLDRLRSRAERESGRAAPRFDPGLLEVEGWAASMSETLRDGADRQIRRVVFDAKDPAERVMIEVVECSGSVDALEALLERLAGNQLAHLPEGPPELGFAVFEHPEEAPPAIFFARANLCVTVASFGFKPTPVRPWAQEVADWLEGGRQALT